jgi:hypothetical protein
MLLILIPTAVAWLGLATLVVCLCRMAALADADRAPRGPRGRMRAEVIVLERVRAGGRARGRTGFRASLQPRGVTPIHPIR